MIDNIPFEQAILNEIPLHETGLDDIFETLVEASFEVVPVEFVIDENGNTDQVLIARNPDSKDEYALLVDAEDDHIEVRLSESFSVIPKSKLLPFLSRNLPTGLFL